jgi:hypothetical protein
MNMKKMIANVWVLLTFSLLNTAAAYAAGPGDSLVKSWVSGEDTLYSHYQNYILSNETNLEEWAESMRAAEGYDSNTWRNQVIAEATLLKSKRADSVENLYHLEGLRSEQYLKWRRPEPAVLRELKKMPELAASMMELYHMGFNAYPWSGPAYEDAERLALQMGLLHAIGESNHPARVFFLADIVESRYSSRAVRLSAVSALAKTGSKDALEIFVSMQPESENDEELRAWIAGSVGHIRDIASWELVAGFLSDSSAKVQSAAMGSIRLLLSRWHWDGRSQELNMLRQEVTPVLVGLLEAEELTMRNSTIGETLSLVGGPLVVESLKERVSDKSITTSTRGRLLSALALAERAERRRR